MKKKYILNVAVITIGIALFLSFVINILFKIHSDGILRAEWDAGDALNYVACIYGAVGTIVLGYVAYKQNDRILELENNNYIANNSAMLLMENIDIKQKANIPINWEIHPEQIVIDKHKQEDNADVGYEFTFTATNIGSATIALVHIIDCTILCSDEHGKSLSSSLFGTNYSDTYSRVAIHKDDKIKFGMTYIVDKSNRASFERAIKQQNYNVTVEFLFNVITDKNVVTKCKCRSYCKGNNTENEGVHWEGEDPMVFFYGHELINNVKVSGEEKNNE